MALKGDDIAARLLEYAARIIKVVDALPRRLAARHISQQLLRCGTATGSHYEEARGAESRADFVHKLGIGWKEIRESAYWLRLVSRSELLKPGRIAALLKEAEELSAILASSIRTARRRGKDPD